jgi:hypothetical protein
MRAAMFLAFLLVLMATAHVSTGAAVRKLPGCQVCTDLFFPVCCRSHGTLGTASSPCFCTCFGGVVVPNKEGCGGFQPDLK